MEKYTTEWWKSQSEDEEIRHTLEKINYILSFTGKWNRRARVLEIQCGLGSMPQFMYDHGYDHYYGIDNNENVVPMWGEATNLRVAEPDNTKYGEKEFHLVCWYTMDDGRIEQDRIPAVLEEMERIGHGAIIIKPFEKWRRGNDNQFLAFMLKHGWVCHDANPASWHYLFYKG